MSMNYFDFDKNLGIINLGIITHSSNSLFLCFLMSNSLNICQIEEF